MDIEKMALLSLFIVISLSAYIITGNIGVESPPKESGTQEDLLDLNSVEIRNSIVSTYVKESGCVPGKGILMTPNSSAGPELITFSNEIIGISLSKSSSWERSNSLYFRAPPSSEECREGVWKSDERSGLPSSSLLVTAKKNFHLKTDGSQICRPGKGNLWKSKNSSASIFTFDGRIIGFGQGNTEIFLKSPPAPIECAEKKYLDESKRNKISGVEAWDLYSWANRKQTFYTKPESCKEWYYGPISQIPCNYTRSGLEQVSLVADPANYVQAPIAEKKASAELLTGKLGNSWDLNFLPDGRAIITYKTGKVVVYDDEKLKNIDKLEGVLNTKLAGLMGVAVDPDFEENHYVYIYYTYDSGDTKTPGPPKTTENRISRFTLVNGDLRNEKVILDSIPGHTFHNGGRLEFGPEGNLYATVGEGGAAVNQFQAQNISTLRGKIIRLKPDGSVPERNPFKDSYVLSRGHRNPQGLAWNPENEVLYASEHGPWRHDEVNRIVKGKNYGWGRFKCGEINNLEVEKIGENTEPEFCTKNWTMAPSGATFVDKSNHTWYGELFVAGLRGKHLHRFKIKEGDIVHNEIFYMPKEIPWTNRIRDVEFRNNSLYVLGDKKWLVKLTPEKQQLENS